MAPEFHNLFTHSAPINGAATALEQRVNWPTVPAKCAVYLLACGESGDSPLLLATVGNLRAALQRRLADTPAEAHTKRIAYGQVCTRVHWRIAHSPFAANWWYWRAAKSLFPDRYRELLGWHPSWWIAVDRHTPFPKLRRTQDLSDPTLDYAGPIRDRTAAGKLIDTLEDLFDLCRYHHILLQTPHGKACAYKEMGKCPAPCDGSVPLSWYEGQMHAAFNFITNEDSSRATWRAAEETRMKTAAATLAFEQASRIKQRLERARLIETDPYTHMTPLHEFTFLALQPGQGRTHIEPWWIHAGQVECWPQFKKKDIPTATLFARCAEKTDAPTPPIDAAATEQIALLAHHLFRGDREPGIYLRVADVLTRGTPFLIRQAEAFFERKSASTGLPEQASDRAPTEDAPPPAEAEMSIATVVSPEADR
jgi:hypothetical protein